MSDASGAPGGLLDGIEETTRLVTHPVTPETCGSPSTGELPLAQGVEVTV